MSVIPSQAAGIAQLIALASFIDQGSNYATLVFYNDTKPSSTTVAADSSAALVTLTLQKPCLLSSDSSSVVLKSTNTAMITQKGTATWARLYNGNDVVVADFAIGTDITLDDELAEGGTLLMNSITLTPKS